MMPKSAIEGTVMNMFAVFITLDAKRSCLVIIMPGGTARRVAIKREMETSHICSQVSDQHLSLFLYTKSNTFMMGIPCLPRSGYVIGTVFTVYVQNVFANVPIAYGSGEITG